MTIKSFEELMTGFTRLTTQQAIPVELSPTATLIEKLKTIVDEINNAEEVIEDAAPANSAELVNAFATKRFEAFIVPFYVELLNKFNGEEFAANRDNYAIEFNKYVAWIEENIGITLPSLTELKIGQTARFETISDVKGSFSGWRWTTGAQTKNCACVELYQQVLTAVQTVLKHTPSDNVPAIDDSKAADDAASSSTIDVNQHFDALMQKFNIFVTQNILASLKTDAEFSQAAMKITQMEIPSTAKIYKKVSALKDFHLYTTKLFEELIVGFYFRLLNKVNSESFAENRADIQKELEKYIQWIKENIGITLPSLNDVRIGEEINVEPNISEGVIDGWDWQLASHLEQCTPCPCEDSYKTTVKAAQQVFRQVGSALSAGSAGDESKSFDGGSPSTTGSVLVRSNAATVAVPVAPLILDTSLNRPIEPIGKLMKSFGDFLTSASMPVGLQPESGFAFRLQTGEIWEATESFKKNLAAAGQNVTDEQINAYTTKLFETHIVKFYSDKLTILNKNKLTDRDAVAQELGKYIVWIKANIGITLPSLLDFPREKDVSITSIPSDDGVITCGWTWQKGSERAEDCGNAFYQRVIGVVQSALHVLMIAPEIKESHVQHLALPSSAQSQHKRVVSANIAALQAKLPGALNPKSAHSPTPKSTHEHVTEYIDPTAKPAGGTKTKSPTSSAQTARPEGSPKGLKQRKTQGTGFHFSLPSLSSFGSVKPKPTKDGDDDHTPPSAARTLHKGFSSKPS